MNLPTRPRRPRAGWGWQRMAAACLLAASGVLPVRAEEDAALRAQVEQKLRLAGMLIADSPAAQRIVASGHAEARAHLEEGRAHQAQAAELLARGELAQARKAIDEALRHLGSARRLVPDPAARQAQLQRRHGEMLASTERLIEAWRGRQSELSAQDSADLASATGLLDGSRQQAAQGRHEEAIATLARAEKLLLAGYYRGVQNATLDYTQRADTPAEAYTLALTQYRALADLLPLAVRDLKPAPATLALVERYAAAASALEGQAVQRHHAGDLEQATADLRNAVLQVQRALSTAGLATPAPTGSSP
ncbi:tetratricopeptide repeat protein [Leptothrix discophora]|uniref:Uncharacterized protein n=1 Tax=Leptothrix discophora TaxID=89 RepID=A0ABT9FY19_LEPDI|nr:hypothetical protein [Leptothrix discophora]MDP4299106.1 hypothetical protein [Leptothrix discophora]